MRKHINITLKGTCINQFCNHRSQGFQGLGLGLLQPGVAHRIRLEEFKHKPVLKRVLRCIVVIGLAEFCEALKQIVA